MHHERLHLCDNIDDRSGKGRGEKEGDISISIISMGTYVILRTCILIHLLIHILIREDKENR